MELLLALTAAHAARPTSLDVLRTEPGGNRIYVQAMLPDGEPGLFLVDTGANVSGLSSERAARLGLDVERDCSGATGLRDVFRMDCATIPWIVLGERQVDHVDVAVGIAGVSSRAGTMPVDGLLGNNVWSRFGLEIDYPADRIVLHDPGDLRLPRTAEPMMYDGHVEARVMVVVDDRRVPLVTQIDTGASELSVCNATGAALAGPHTEGIEMVLGVGAPEGLPVWRDLPTTRRVPYDSVHLGGAHVDREATVRWWPWEDGRTSECNAGFRALLGHELLAGHRVLIDYDGGRWALARSRGKERSLDGHRVLLDQELARHGEAPHRGLVRARLQIGLADDKGAMASLEAYLETLRDGGESTDARLLLAAIRRVHGDDEGAREAVAALDAVAITEGGDLVASVNALLLADRAEEAAVIAEEAVLARPELPDVWIARADLRLFRGEADPARLDLVEAERRSAPDDQLMRRARVALAEGDRQGAMAHARRLLELYPLDGQSIWFYAMLVEGVDETMTFAADVDSAMARLHPEHRPTDFLVAASRILGDEQRVEQLMAEGLRQHCAPLRSGAAYENCVAWYQALGAVDLDEALARVERALAESGPRPDYLDTLAMVRLARGEIGPATDAARQAARMEPDNVYLLWQAERLGQQAER